jgi:DNA polymerase V
MAGYGIVSAPRPLDVSPHPVPAALEAVHAGFPSVAQDYFTGDFSLDENLIIHPDTTFVVSVAGDSMEGAGIFDGDILIVDRSLRPRPDDIVIAAVDGELTVKRLAQDRQGGLFLHPENAAYPDIRLDPGDDMMVWGVVIGNYHWQCSRAQYGRPAVAGTDSPAQARTQTQASRTQTQTSQARAPRTRRQARAQAQSPGRDMP